MVSVKEKKSKKMNVKTVQKSDKVKKLKQKKELPPKQITLTGKESLIKEVSNELTKTAVSKKKIKYVMPSKYITEDLVNSCLSALQQLDGHNKKKNKMFEDEATIFAEIRCVKIQNSSGNVKFILPHSTVASTGEVCLITPDLKKGRKIDHEPTVDRWEEILRNAGVTSVKTVLPMRQLRVEYDQYELKRRLMTQHDFIMVDTRVLTHVSHLLGKMFFKKHNMLIPVRLNENKNLKRDIDIGLRTSMLRLNEGATSVITVGHTGMPQNHVKENVIALVQQIREKYPGGEANIRSISLKLPLSLSLPLYTTLRPTSAVDTPRLKHKKPKNFTVLEDDLSTIQGGTVRVAPDGSVHFKKSKLENVRDIDKDDDAPTKDDDDESEKEE